MTEEFCLKWNDFQSNISKSFSTLRKEENFLDVTLVSDDQTQVRAHKVVLSSCSEYFKNILKQTPHPIPMLCLEGISSRELNNILDYIYCGEVNVYQDDLSRFLGIAERFKLQGLLSGENATKNCGNSETKTKVIKNEFEGNDINLAESEGEFVQNNEIVIKPEELANIKEIDAKLIKHLERDVKSKWKCMICNKVLRDKANAKRHAEIHFDDLKYPCLDCDVILKSRNSLWQHKKIKHPNMNTSKLNFHDSF